MDKSFYFGEFTHTESDIKLHALAKRYHEQCEAYDRTVCTGPIVHGSIRPMNSRELILINRHAAQVKLRILEEAFREGFERAQVMRAISKYYE